MSNSNSQPTAIGHLLQNRMGLKHLSVPKEPSKQLPEQDQEPESGRFVYPILTSKGKENDFAITIKRYNNHIKAYNAKVAKLNAAVKLYNREVIRNRKQITVSTEQRVKEAIWKEEHKDLDPEAYNDAVERYNAIHGQQIRKIPLKQPVRKTSEKFFIAILHQFNMQLFKRQSLRKQLGIAHLAELPKVEIYPNRIVDNERDGYKTLPVSVETVRHHRERLEEAGVLSEYEFRGDHRAVKMRINAQILSITDNGIQKNTAAENQALKESQTNKVRHNNVSSRGHVVNKNKIRDKGVCTNAQTTQFAAQGSTRSPIKRVEKNRAAQNFNTAPENNLPEAGPQKKFLGTAAEKSSHGLEKGAKSSHGLENSGAASRSSHGLENKKPIDKNPQSTVLQNSIFDVPFLVRGLAAGKYTKYHSISKKTMQQEAYYGAMHPEDYTELVIQDLFKFSSSIFEKLEGVHPGSWMNAYKTWMADKFKSFNGYRMSKPNIFEFWGKTKEVLKEVKAYAKNHPEWYPHYPSLYFDTARDQKEHNSFEYAYRNFRLEDEKLDTYKRRKINANKSLRHKTDVKKLQDKMRQYFNGRADLQEVYDYAQQNLSPAVNDQLNQIFKREFDAFYNHN